MLELNGGKNGAVKYRLLYSGRYCEKTSTVTYVVFIVMVFDGLSIKSFKGVWYCAKLILTPDLFYSFVSQESCRTVN